MPENDYRELARRLLAAVMSYRMGHKRIDYMLERIAPEGVGQGWCELAKQIYEGIAHTLPPRPANHPAPMEGHTEGTLTVLYVKRRVRR